MLGEAKLAQEMAAKLFEQGIYVTGFFYPVVPQGKARIRTQMSAAHASAGRRCGDCGLHAGWPRNGSDLRCAHW